MSARGFIYGFVVFLAAAGFIASIVLLAATYPLAALAVVVLTFAAINGLICAVVFGSVRQQ